ncbi:MAG: 5'/3'-nucleotidase SurE [Prevotella sp.]|nr:5'/3'-nucleotidase SurE [Prevotella sp.]MBR6190688.1 5'/3'-nucleotidase SurE [Prevotella sp.]
MNDTSLPLILISNDDGYHAKGINSLIDMLKGMGNIIVCAPESARSGYSRAFSTTPLTMKHRRHYDHEDTTIDVWSCSGTPVDCIKMAYHRLCPKKADIIIGGINHGDNASTNLHYSGTVGIVMEGALKRIPSVAFSLCDYDDDADFEPMRPLVQKVVGRILKEGLPIYTCLNVNVPKDWNGETHITRMAHGHWRNEVEDRRHPKGTPYYWMAGYYQNDEPDETDTDAWAVANGFAAITPLTADQTDYQFIRENEAFLTQ